MGNMHQQQKYLEDADFKSTGRSYNTPEGYLRGWGTTVGNSIEGWAPGCIFQDTDAAQGSQIYVNTGTKTTATWTEIADAGVAGGFAMTGTQDISGAGKITLEDDCEVVFGTGDDLQIAWDGTNLTSGPPSGLWAGAPSPIDPDPYKCVALFDDFLLGNDPDTPLAHWVEVDDGTTGTNIPGDIRGGSVKIVTAGADNDYHALRSMSQCFNLAATKEMWFEARFRLVEAATSQSVWWFGLTDTLTTGGMQADALGPLASYDGILVWKDEDTMLIDVETSNAGSQDTEANIATFVTNTWTRVGFHVTPAATTGICTAYFDVGDSGVMTAHSATMDVTRSGLEEMHVVMGVKSKGSVETLEVDYVKCVQIR